MTAIYPIFGDPMLQPISPAEYLQRPSGLFWGIDFSNSPSKKLGKARLHETEVALRKKLDLTPSVLKVVVAFRLPKRTRLIKITVPGGIPVRLHNDLERERGRDVQFLFLEVTSCLDQNLLRQRIDEIMQLPASTWSTMSLSWQDFELCSIQEAMAEQVL